MSEWKKVKIKDICSIKSGKRLPKGADFELFSTENKYIRARDIKNGVINGENLAYISQDTKEKISKYIVNTNDIVITIAGTIGEVAFVTPQFDGVNLTENAVRLTDFNRNANPKYIFYILRTDEYYQLMQTIAGGAAQPKMGIYKVEAINISLPSIDTQDKIVCILSRYDSLIENYQRQIKLLEEAAQRLYKEWFVDLHFPGHETTPIIDGIPEGWEKKKLGEIISYEIGGGWGFDDNSNKDTVPAYVIRGTDMEGLRNGSFLSLPFRYHLESNFKSRRLEHCDIIFEVSGGSKTEGVAKTFLVQDSLLNQFNAPVICASFCKLIRLKCPKTAYYVYDTLKYWRASGITTQYDKRSASSIVNYRWKEFLEQQEIMIPNDKVLAKYLDKSKLIHSRMSNLANQIHNLTEARDRLLPKLMSGEIDIV